MRRSVSERNRSYMQRLVELVDFGPSKAPPLRVGRALGPHHEWLEENLAIFFRGLGQMRVDRAALISDHGNKCEPFREKWDAAGIPFCHGVAIYLLSYTYPYNTQVRETKDGWSDVETWVMNNYAKFRGYLPPPDPILP